YTTFTEDTNKTITPIKFAIPPYALSAGNNTIVFSNSFEDPVVTPSQDFTAPATFDSWSVVSNSVTLTNDPPRAQTGDQYVILHRGGLHQSLVTQGGKAY